MTVRFQPQITPNTPANGRKPDGKFESPKNKVNNEMLFSAQDTSRYYLHHSPEKNTAELRCKIQGTTMSPLIACVFYPNEPLSTEESPYEVVINEFNNDTTNPEDIIQILESIQPAPYLIRFPANSIYVL